MKIIHFFARIYFLICVLIFVACNNYLDIQSNASQVVPKDLEDLQQVLDASQNMNFHFCSIGEVSADDYFLKQNVYNGLNETSKSFYIWEAIGYNYDNDWAKAYIPVYNSNLVLEGLSKIAREVSNESSWDNVRGSALFYRSIQYLSLVWTYAKGYNPLTAEEDLGIVLRKTADFNVKSERATVEESYRNILDGLLEASILLPENAAYVTRPSKRSAYAALARAYLSMGMYDSAYYYSDKLLKAQNELMDFNDINDVKLSASYPFSRFNGETIGYFEMVTINTQVSVSYASIDTTLYRSYDENDLRRSAYFKVNTDGYPAFRGSYSGGTRLFGGLAVDEMLLIRSECLVRLGRLQEGLDDLNRLLQSRFKIGTYVPKVQLTQDQALDLILTERRKELIFRGVRWSDIKRLNIEGRNIEPKRLIDGKDYLLPSGDNRYAIPLPDDVVRLADIPQNPK